jgi:fibronectin-binding autotransporter adhesin
MKSKHRILITLTTAVFYQLAASAQAQNTYDWTSETDSSWGTDTNWTANGIPVSNDTANFTTVGSTATITLDDNRQIKVLSFNNANATWTLNEGTLSGAKLNITDGDATGNESNNGVSATIDNTTLNLNVGLGSYSGSAASDEVAFTGTNGTVNLTKAFTQRLHLGTLGTSGSVAMVYNLDAADIVKSRIFPGFNNTVANVPVNSTAGTTVNVNASQTTTDEVTVGGGNNATNAGALVIRNGTTWTQNGAAFNLGFSNTGGTSGVCHGRVDVGVVGDSVGNLTIGNSGALTIANRAGKGILHINNGSVTVNANNDTGLITLASSAGTGGVVGGNGTLNLNAGGTLVTARNFVTTGSGAGTFNFDGGLLQINRATGNVTTDLFSGTGITVNVLDGGARIDTQDFSTVINLPLSGVGTGGLEKLGTGTLTLNGQSTYKGDTVVTEGILAVNGNSIPDSSALQIDGTGKVDVAAATVEVVGTLYFDGAPQAFGSWGSTDSTADNTDDDRFSGEGIVYSLEAANDQSFVWAGTGLSDSWSDIFSWDPVGLPAATDSAAFTTPGTAATINLDGNQEIESLTFSDANTTWNIEEGSLAGAKLNFTDGDATGNENILATVNLTDTTLNLNAAIGAFAGSSAADEVIFISNGSTVNLSKPSSTRTGMSASEVSGAADATYNLNATNIITSRLHVGFNETPGNVPQNGVASTFVRANADQTGTDEIRVGGGTGSEFGVLTLRNNATWTQSGSAMLIGFSNSGGIFGRTQGRVEIGEAGSAGFLTIGTGGNLIVGERGGFGVLDITNGTLTALADADTDKIGLGWTGNDD